ncbi:ACP S-malonyltransferase, partial [Thiogranum longum]
AAAEVFANDLDTIPIRTPSVRVLHNADVCSHEEPGAIRKALAAQLYSPVRWVETIRAMHADGIDTLLEMGPGKVLTGLNKRIEKSMSAIPVQTADDLQTALATLG